MKLIKRQQIAQGVHSDVIEWALTKVLKDIFEDVDMSKAVKFELVLHPTEDARLFNLGFREAKATVETED